MWHGVDAEMRSGSTMAYSNAMISHDKDMSIVDGSPTTLPSPIFSGLLAKDSSKDLSG